MSAASEPQIVEQSESILQIALDFLALIRRHLLLVGVCLGGSLGIVTWILRHDRPVYRAAAVIRLADKSRSLAGGLTPPSNDRIGGALVDPILSQVQVLQSGEIAEKIAIQQGLQLHSLTRDFGWAYLDSITVAQGAVFDTIFVHFRTRDAIATMGRDRATANYGQPLALPGVRFIVLSRPKVDDAKLIVRPLSSAMGEVLGGLRGRPRERTDVVDVTYQDFDPVRARRVVNAAITVFQAQDAQNARETSARRRDFIADQLRKADAMLSEAQLQLNGFRSREHVYSSQDKFKSQQSDLSSLDVRRQELQADRGMYAQLLAALDSVPPGSSHDERLDALMASPGIASNPVVSELFGQWLKLRSTRDSLTTGAFAAAATNPDVKRLDALIIAAQANMLTAVRGQMSSTDARLDALDQMKTNTTQELARLPDAEAREADLGAQVETYQRQSQQLRDQLQAAEIEEAAVAGQVQIIDTAQGSTAVGAARGPRVAFAIFLGLALGGVAAYILENYSAVIRKRDDVERAVALPNLAIIPRIQQGAPGAVPALRRFAMGRDDTVAADKRLTNGKVSDLSQLVILSDSRSGGAEAYRTLRTNLLFSSAIQSLRTLVVTSSGPKEGKSTTAANLAVAFAQQGKQVILVECDLRKPRVHKLFEVAQDPGLTNVLLGQVPVESALHETRVPGLRVLTCGPVPPNPVELLGSEQFKALLAAVDADMIVLDTPPLLVASDAAVLGRLADGVILVVRAGSTQRAALQDCAQQLLAIGARVVGTVLNDPDAEVAKYSSYYQYYYNEYYDYSHS